MVHCTSYSKLQKYFNNCLREFYEARKLGKYYYYSLPGLLLTHTNYKRTPPHINKLVDTSIWNPIDIHVEDYTHDDDKVSSINILHINPDYNVIKRIISHSYSNTNQYHIIFTNSYNLEFLSFIESSKLYDINQQYKNLRLITGSYCTFHLIFYEKLFHYVFLYITNTNYRNLLRLNVIRSLHNCLHPFCKIIFITQDKEISQALFRHSESQSEVDNTNPLASLLSNLSNKFVPEFEAYKHFTGVNLDGLSTLQNNKMYSIKDNITSEYDYVIADYIYQNDVNNNKLRNKSDNLSSRFCHKYYRIDKNIPNLKLVKPITM